MSLIKQVTTCMLLACTGLVSANTLYNEYKPEGEFVLLFNAFRIYFHCQGEGRETVVIDAGIGDALANWLPVQEKLSGHTRVCLYDRAGYGLSDPGPGPRTTAQITFELYAWLKKAGIEGPYVLVGHSFGGYTAQFFASQFPQETAGLVLVDSSHSRQVKRLAKLDTLEDAPRKSVGGYRFEDESRLTPAQKLWKHLNAQRKSVWTQMDELGSFSDSADEVNGIVKHLPPVPLAVLTRGRSQLPTIPGDKSMETVWHEMQEDLTTMSPHSWQVIARDSGHSIHQEAPEVIVENTLKVIRQASLARDNSAAASGDDD